MIFRMLAKRALLLFTLALAFPLPGQAQSVFVNGVEVQRSTKVANTQLKLNGTGLRKLSIFGVYVVALYLPEVKHTTDEILALTGPKQIQVSMLREMTGEGMGNHLVEEMVRNASKPQRDRIANQIENFRGSLETIPAFKNRDVITLEWVPNMGSQVSLNGKHLGGPFPDRVFFEALVKIWIGEQPTYAPLKLQLLGEN